MAAIGMAIGTGAYFMAVSTTVLTTVLLVLLSSISARLERQARKRNAAPGAGYREPREHADDDGPQFMD